MPKEHKRRLSLAVFINVDGEPHAEFLSPLFAVDFFPRGIVNTEAYTEEVARDRLFSASGVSEIWLRGCACAVILLRWREKSFGRTFGGRGQITYGL